VVVYHKYLRSSIPTPELRVKPGIVLPADLTLVEVRFGRVEHHNLGLTFRHFDRGTLLAHPEKRLEVPVANVPGVMVAHRHDHRALYAVEVSLSVFELPRIALRRKVTGYDDEVRQEGIGFLDGG
jgi:hypothetical protein